MGAIWAVLPGNQVCFVGDAVLADQPPFLAGADLPVWIETLQALLQPAYQNYLLVSGRGGLVTHDQVRSQVRFLEKTHGLLEELAGRNAPVEEAVELSGQLLESFPPAGPRQLQYQQRLHWGLRQYYLRYYRKEPDEELEE